MDEEKAESAKRARYEEQERDLARLVSAAVQSLPTHWKGRRYLRLEKVGDPKAAQKADDRERERWGRKVIEILVNLRLAFGLELEAKGDK